MNHGTTINDLMAQVERIDSGKPIPELQPITRAVMSPDELRDYIIASNKRHRYFEETDEQGRRRCLECKEFQPIVKGTDHCAECLKKIDEEDV